MLAAVIKKRKFGIEAVSEKLSPVEYERLQTLPDGFTEGYSDNVRRTLCGNGWTKEVIKHIFKGL